MKIKTFAANDSGQVLHALPSTTERFDWLQASPRNALVFANEEGQEVLLARQADEETYYLAFNPVLDPDDVIEGDLVIEFPGAVNTVFSKAADALETAAM